MRHFFASERAPHPSDDFSCNRFKDLLVNFLFCFIEEGGGVKVQGKWWGDGAERGLHKKLVLFIYLVMLMFSHPGVCSTSF